MANGAFKFKSVKELKTAIDDYFVKADSQGKPYTVAGMALSLGIDKNILINCDGQNADPKFARVIKNAKNRIMEGLEENLLDSNRKNISGVIFLARNYGYTDEQEAAGLSAEGNFEDLDETIASLISKMSPEQKKEFGL